MTGSDTIWVECGYAAVLHDYLLAIWHLPWLYITLPIVLPGPTRMESIRDFTILGLILGVAIDTLMASIDSYKIRRLLQLLCAVIVGLLLGFVAIYVWEWQRTLNNMVPNTNGVVKP